MLNRALTLSLTCMLLLSGSQFVFADLRERDIPLCEVPDKIIDAARAALPGIVLTEAEVSGQNVAQLYEIEGDLNGKSYEVEVNADGEVLDVSLDD